jgi:heme-degrading monooxygenase HmoA
MQSRYACIWQYRVGGNSVHEFERAYGPEGPWVKLFRRHSGYVRTELHRDLQKPSWYITVDYWQSKEATCLHRMSQ